MAVKESCKWCGEWFDKKGNQQYCCKECGRLGRQRNERLRCRGKSKRKKQNAPSLSINNMVDIMMNMSEERGRVVQYGEVQKMMLTGRLKVKDGVIG